MMKRNGRIYIRIRLQIRTKRITDPGGELFSDPNNTVSFVEKYP
jgi:hypothetical protein